MKNCILSLLLLCSFHTFSQANFAGNVFDNESKSALNNVKLMVIEENDTTYIKPDKNGNFNFQTKPGRVKIFTVADGFISEMNSVNAGNGSNNKINIGLVKEEVFTEMSKKVPTSAESSYDKESAYTHTTKTRTGSSFSSDGDGGKDEYVEEKNNSSVKSGVLTAGEVNDFAKWKLWNDLNSSEFTHYSKIWKLNLHERYCIQLKLTSGMPIIDALVTLNNGDGTKLWSARTDNTGKVELWIIDSAEIGKKNLSVNVEYGEIKQKFDRIHSFKDGLNSFEIDAPCTVPDQLDIAFVVDATGSMGDEINYLKKDLDNVISEIESDNKHINLRMGSVFYRDKGDEYLTKTSPFSNNIELVKTFININNAGGGGDFPEAADLALIEAIEKLNWSSASRARIIFWVLDAPPHQAEENIKRIQELCRKAAEKGIKIIPVGCSGINKATEFICRNIALATNGTYTFLTKHSGIGGSHIEPSTDGYKVESFRDVLVRIAKTMSITPDCNDFIAPEQIVQIDTNIKIINPYGTKDTLFVNKTIDSSQAIIDLEISLFPNPTNGIFNIKSPKEITEVFLADVNGKILENIKLNENGVTRCDASIYSNGVYFIQYHNTQRWTCKRLVIHH